MQTREHAAALGRRRGARSVRAVALMLPGGEQESMQPRLRLPDVFLWPLARRIARRGRRAGVAVHLVRYRYRGWNGDRADPLADARWALAEVRRRYGPVPVALVGHSLGGRVAAHAAGDPQVSAVVLLAPWLEEADPVEPLRGRRVLVIHGARDRTTDPGASYRFALAARRAGARICRMEPPRAGHVLLRHRRAWTPLVIGVVVATLTGGRLDPLLRDATAATGTAGLRIPPPRRREQVVRRRRRRPVRVAEPGVQPDHADRPGS